MSEKGKEEEAPLPFPDSLCHRCAAPPRYVKTKTSVFIMCPLMPEKTSRSEDAGPSSAAELEATQGAPARPTLLSGEEAQGSDVLQIGRPGDGMGPRTGSKYPPQPVRSCELFKPRNE